MKKFLILFLLFSNVAFGQFKVPERKSTYIHDYENLLSPEQSNALNQKVTEITKKSSIQFAVVILNDLQGYSIEEAALEIGRVWGVGQKGLDNGIVYLVSPVNRKARIEIAYGLEGVIPDVVAQAIGDEVKPFYKNNEWYNGINKVLTSLDEKLDPEKRAQLEAYEKAQAEKNAATLRVVGQVFLYLLLSAGIIILLVWWTKLKKRHREVKRQAKDFKDNKAGRLDKLVNLYGVDFLENELGGGDYTEFKKISERFNEIYLELFTVLISRKRLKEIESEIDDLTRKLSRNEIYYATDKELDRIQNQVTKAKSNNDTLAKDLAALFELYGPKNQKFAKMYEEIFRCFQYKSVLQVNSKLIALRENLINFLRDNVSESSFFKERLAKNKITYKPSFENVVTNIQRQYHNHEKELKQLKFPLAVFEVPDNDVTVDYKELYEYANSSLEKLTNIIATKIPESKEYKERVAKEKREEEERKRLEAERKRREEEEKKREEERRKRRRQEEAEDEERRRRSNYNSGGGGWSGFDSSGGGSSGGSSDYGGGSFGGGGSTSDW